MRIYPGTLLLLMFLWSTCFFAQDDAPVAAIDIPAQNQLKFDRFLINPTFSTVNEDFSYLNLYHRNQWVSFEDNYQTYLGSYSGRISDRSGVGVSVYHQRFGTISNFGAIANYAYGIRLSEISNLTFGFNLSYYNSGVDQSNIITPDPDDPTIANLEDGNLISFQPGLNLSIGKFDVGVYAENAFDYNIDEGEQLTEFDEKTFTGHLMYTTRFKNGQGIMEDAKLAALSRARFVPDRDVNLSGSLILDLPKLGWVQAGYDDYYGVAAGVGFNFTKRLSLGYTIEKGVSGQVANFGVTHEINFAYAFQPTLSENRVFEDLEEDENLLVLEEEELLAEEEAIDTITDKKAEIKRLRSLVAENNMIIDEMMFKQDSMEEARKNDINKRFAYIIKYVNDNKGKGNEAEVKKRAVAMMKEIDEDAYNEAQQKYERDYNNIGASNEKRAYVANNPKPTKNKNSIAQNSNEVSPKPSVGNKDVSSQNRIAASATTNLANVDSGAYVIANVYQDETYMHKFIDDLESKGIEAGYFEKNGLKYVYIDKYNSAAEASLAGKSNFNGKYNGEVWVMNVKNTTDAALKEGAYASNQKSIRTSKEKRNIHPDINTDSELLSNGLSYCTNRYVNSILNSDKLDYDEAITQNVPQPEKGYYLIANVFAKDDNAYRYVKKLKDEGFDADIYINPKNNYKYVYLSKYESWNKAMVSYRSSINYKNDIWIMPLKHT
ncbi:PorP/SprF family type IX secretion system membrane protein [Galbibacter mesophilus]|uniref:PorP/SprF family type IX secretion system membrane protein n=1 Tax=Galbibacter mesophilus TaxID=379069 RepID=UPI00191E4066|nr:PorP/SprF family type IX secretion system membrane protein [Galbibacter mesophilus]MCM5662287.1 PorP/SprF family type IX secretion system membrane protein [Galbibacter mesophilus]